MGSARIGEIIEILRNHVDLSAANFDYEGSAAIGILQLSDGSIRIVLNAVIDESAPEDDGWIWEYIAVNAGMGMFDGSYFDD